ncbi:MAG: nucleotidyltransferase family protein [Thermoanaerobaculia bacterium]|nr:nucleotidyltransferase family protein [Thermoanaerobaculia bacterium]
MRERSGFRFRPPPGELSPELRAVVGLALAPAPPDSEALDPDTLWELAGRLELREAMAGRLSGWPEGGGHGALRERLRSWRRLCVARDLLHEEAARQVAAAAADHGLPVIWLKGFALRQAGIHPSGRRAHRDLDLLTSREGAPLLDRLLGERGWRRHGRESNEQHLPPLESPEGCYLDIHFRLRGVRLGSRGWARAREVLEQPGTRAAEGVPGSSLPGHDLLAAHVLVHAVAQHGHRPASYGLLRAVDDLAALLPTGEAWRRFAAGPYRWIARSVSRRELDALATLTSALARGELPDPAEQPDADRLLRHAQAGATDPRYARSLRGRHRGERIREALAEGHLGAYLRRKLAGLRLG